MRTTTRWVAVACGDTATVSSVLSHISGLAQPASAVRTTYGPAVNVTGLASLLASVTVTGGEAAATWTKVVSASAAAGARRRAVCMTVNPREGGQYIAERRPDAGSFVFTRPW